MPARNGSGSEMARTWVAGSILVSGVVAIVILAGIAIAIDTKNAMTVLNMVLPVIASWIGTILAFYFGRENFESANRQVREMIERLTPEERARTRVTAIMRRMADVVCFQIPQGQGDQDVALAELRKKFSDTISRLPVLDPDGKVKYMIHQSRIDKHIADGGRETDSLETFIAGQKAAGVEFGLDRGFIVVSANTTLVEAKRKAEAANIQDIFVTERGTADEPPIGWISNVRMAKYLEA
jgi:CBS domain-containing protein